MEVTGLHFADQITKRYLGYPTVLLEQYIQFCIDQLDFIKPKTSELLNSHLTTKITPVRGFCFRSIVSFCQKNASLLSKKQIYCTFNRVKKLITDECELVLKQKTKNPNNMDEYYAGSEFHFRYNLILYLSYFVSVYPSLKARALQFLNEHSTREIHVPCKDRTKNGHRHNQ